MKISHLLWPFISVCALNENDIDE